MGKCQLLPVKLYRPVLLLALLLPLLTGCELNFLKDDPAPLIVTVPPPTVPPSGPPTPTLDPLFQPPPPEATLAPGGGARSLGDPYAPELGNGGYFVQSYNLRLNLDPQQQAVSGYTEILAVSNQQGLSQLSLDFAGFDVSSVQVDATPAEFYRERYKLVVTLPAPLASGTNFRILVTYAGSPLQEPSRYLPIFNHLGLTYPGTNSIFVFGQPDGARYWFPSNDHPRDKATFRFEITVPQGLTAVANGVLVGSQPDTLPDGRSGETFIWSHEYPMAPYLAQVAVGHYVALDSASPAGIPMRHYVFPDLVPQIQALDPVAGDALDWMAQRFGPYPFERFGVVTADVRRLSLETQTMVLLSDQMLIDRVVVHEISHMWFGNWVSLDSWADLWRNEGFATYIAALYLSGDDPALLAAELAKIREDAAKNPSGAPLNQLPPDKLFGTDAYNGGALLVHELRLEIGDEAFFNGLRTYFARYGGGTASHEEFQAVMEEAAGRALDGVFVGWLK
ncbi:MAG: M1 family metallopeptidase [Anaerolineales bacterium]|nr:M1 family metallopeptidase [Anaerolineales bacterium]